MAKTAYSAILQFIHRIWVDPRMRVSPDPELLQRFLGEQDEAAFEAILRHHGPMVLDVCRGVLANEADAEDAFQATFLVLARKAASIRKAATLASWLHGVAYRTALKARAGSAQRRKHEAHVPERPASGPDSLTWTEVRGVLHEELSRLSERYRGPLVLCYLQGKTQDEAAALVGLSKGTLKRRLERGRALLRERLVRRGLGPAALLLASGWPAATATAGVPQALVVSTVKAALLTAAGRAVTAGLVSAQAAALSEGVLHAMWLAKVKGTAAVLLIVGLMALGGGAMTYHTVAAQKAAARGDGALAGPPATAREKTVTPDLKVLADGKGGTIPTDATLKWVEDAKGRPALKVQAKWDHTVIPLDRIEFTNGVIEFDALGQSGPSQSNYFGFAFRVADEKTYDAVYFRPFNFRAEEAERKARAVQYGSHPKYDWEVLRKDKPGQYEKPIVPAPDGDAWFHVRIVVEKPKVRVYVNNGKEPCLVVDELSDRKGGGVGLWVGPGQGGYFANLKITPAK
jgi:RNA polymerase sigma factor (sigma-70 family)